MDMRPLASSPTLDIPLYPVLTEPTFPQSAPNYRRDPLLPTAETICDLYRGGQGCSGVSCAKKSLSTQALSATPDSVTPAWETIPLLFRRLENLLKNHFKSSRRPTRGHCGHMRQGDENPGRHRGRPEHRERQRADTPAYYTGGKGGSWP